MVQGCHRLPIDLGRRPPPVSPLRFSQKLAFAFAAHSATHSATYLLPTLYYPLLPTAIHRRHHCHGWPLLLAARLTPLQRPASMSPPPGDVTPASTPPPPSPAPAPAPRSLDPRGEPTWSKPTSPRQPSPCGRESKSLVKQI